MIVVRPANMDRLCNGFLRLCDLKTTGPFALNEENDLAHRQVQFIRRAGLFAIECKELIQCFVADLLGCPDMLEYAEHRILRIADFNVHELDLLFKCFAESCIEKVQLAFKGAEVYAIGMLRLDWCAQRNDFAASLIDQNWIQVCSADSHIGCGTPQAGNDLYFSVQAMRNQLAVIGVQQIIGLPVEAPNGRNDGMVIIGRQEGVAGKLVVKKVLDASEHFLHFQHCIVRGISTMYCRDFFICYLDQTVTGGNIQAVVEDLRQYRL